MTVPEDTAPEPPDPGATPRHEGVAGDRAAATPAESVASTPAATPAVGAPPAMSGDRVTEEATAATPDERPAVEASPAAKADLPAPAPARPARRPGVLEERPEIAIAVPKRRLAAQSRRDFLLFAAGALATAAGTWWLLPDRTRARLAPDALLDPLDTLAARVGLSPEARERALDRALTFDDDVAEALYSTDRKVRTYHRSQVTPLRNNYDGQTPGPEYLPGWRLTLSGLASGSEQRLAIGDVLSRFTLHEQVTRLVCVEGWSAIAWWGGIRFADLLAAFPPAPGARWAALRSSVNLDGRGRPNPYYVSIDLGTARHPQTLLATHQNGRPLTLAHGAPMRLLVPMKLGLKNIKAVTDIAYTTTEPADYWNEQGYSKYDGL